MTYKYNDAGERVFKTGPQGETVYVNQFYTVGNRESGSKHFFVGTTRIATKMVKKQENVTTAASDTDMLTDTATAKRSARKDKPDTSSGDTAATTTTGNNGNGNGNGSNSSGGNPDPNGNAYGLENGNNAGGNSGNADTGTVAAADTTGNNGNGNGNGSNSAGGNPDPVGNGYGLENGNNGNGCDGNSGVGCDGVKGDAGSGSTDNGGTTGGDTTGGNSGTTAGNTTAGGNNGGGSGGGSNNNGKIIYEPDVYYYHPNHLGSTAFTSDVKGDIYEHLEYFPFGETWVEEASDIHRVPYLFTSKELDRETGLYYFGARYYDPRTSVWQSCDPILGTYLDGEAGMGGIHNPFNLGLYIYGHLNPVKFFDPDGNTVCHYGDKTKVYINGIRSPLDKAVEQGRGQLGSNKFTLAHNPTNGFFGDILESAYQKARGIPIIGRFLIYRTKEEREVADLLMTLDKGSVVTAHSQGAIILIRAIEHLNRLGIKLDGIKFILNGAAVSEGKARNAIDQSGGTLEKYNAGSLDPVQHLFGTSLMEKLKHPIRTIKSLVGFFDIQKYHVEVYNQTNNKN